MSVNGTLVEDKMRRFKGECGQYSFNKCLIYTHDGASATFSTNSHDMDNSVVRDEVQETWVERRGTRYKTFETRG